MPMLFYLSMATIVHCEYSCVSCSVLLLAGSVSRDKELAYNWPRRERQSLATLSIRLGYNKVEKKHHMA